MLDYLLAHGSQNGPVLNVLFVQNGRHEQQHRVLFTEVLWMSGTLRYNTGWRLSPSTVQSMCVCVCVRYVPSLWVDQLDSLPEVGKNEINVVNQQLVNRLKSTDTAFSLGSTLQLVMSSFTDLSTTVS